MFRPRLVQRARRRARRDDGRLRLRRRRRRARGPAAPAQPRALGSCSTPTRSTRSPPTRRCSRCWSRARAAACTTVLTPHPLEAARLLGHQHRRRPGRPARRRAGARRALRGDGRAQGFGHRDRRAGSRAGASARPATPSLAIAPAPATCWPAGSAACGPRPQQPPKTARSSRPGMPSSTMAPRPSRGAGALRAADLVECSTGACAAVDDGRVDAARPTRARATANGPRADRPPVDGGRISPPRASPCRPPACPGRCRFPARSRRGDRKSPRGAPGPAPPHRPGGRRRSLRSA